MIAYALIPITGVEVPLEGFIPVEIPEVVNIGQIETQQEIESLIESKFDNCSNDETSASKSVKLKSILSNSTDNIIYASIAEADICKCEPQECQQSNCCLDCYGREDVCADPESASNFS